MYEPADPWSLRKGNPACGASYEYLRTSESWILGPGFWLWSFKTLYRGGSRETLAPPPFKALWLQASLPASQTAARPRTLKHELQGRRHEALAVEILTSIKI